MNLYVSVCAVWLNETNKYLDELVLRNFWWNDRISHVLAVQHYEKMTRVGLANEFILHHRYHTVILQNKHN